MARTRTTVIVILWLLAASSSVALGIPCSVDAVATSAVYNIIVIPVYSQDQPPVTSIGTILDRMNEVQNYFLAASYETITFSSEVVGWTLLPEEMSSYAKNTTHENGVVRVTAHAQIVHDALSNAVSLVSLQSYDAVVVVHAGESNQASGSADDIGTCFIGQPFSAGGATFDGACVVSEHDDQYTLVHELVHWLGGDDLYDYRGEEHSVSRYCIMGEGSSDMCAYTKLNLGFIQNHEVFTFEGGAYQITLSPLSWQHKEYRAVRFDLQDGRYLLMEARDCRVGLDSALGCTGLLVTLVNETTIKERNGGVEIQTPPGSSGTANATFVPGETYAGVDNSIYVSVVEWSQHGLVVHISDESREDWTTVERIGIDDDANIRFIDLLHANASDSFYLAFLCVEHDGWTSARVYRTFDHGRVWTQLFDSYGLFNISYHYSHSLCWNRESVILVASVQRNGHWKEALVDINCDAVSILDFEGLVKVNETLRPTFDASSDGSRLYMALMSYLGGVSGVTLLTLDKGEWGHGRVVMECSEICLSTCLEADQLPDLWVSNATGLYSGVFNSSLTKILPNGSWRIDAVQSGSSFASFMWAANDTTFIRLIARHNESSVDDVFMRETSTTVFPKLCTTGNALYLALTGDNFTLIRLDANGTFEYVSATFIDRVSLSSSDSPEWQHPLLVLYQGSRMSTLSWQRVANGVFEVVVWFTITTSNGLSDLTALLGPVAAGATVVVVISSGTVYFRRRKQARAK